MSTGSGLVETLWAGFATVNRRPDILVLPAAVNGIVWLGPRLTARPVVEAAGTALAGWLAVMAADPSLGPSAEQARQASQDLPAQMEVFASLNLVGLAGWALPGMIAVKEELGQQVVDLAGGPLLLALGALPAVGLALGAIFYQQVAGAVRGEPARLGRLVVGLPRFFLRQAAWIAMLLAALLIAGSPLLVIVGLVSLLSPALGVGLLLIAWSLLLIAGWWLFFQTSAMFLDDVGPLQGLIRSVTVVARDRGPSLLFVAVVSLIALGWGLVWSGIEGIPAASVLRIAGHTYVSCGLVAATMIFYRDRAGVPAAVARAGQTVH